MTNRGMAVLALRLFALYLFVDALRALPELYLLLAQQPEGGGRYYYLVTVAHLGPVLLGVLLWAYVGRWVDLLLPQRRAAEPPERPLTTDWHVLGIALAGLLVAALGAPALLEAAMTAYLQSRELVELTTELQARLLASGLQVVLGLFLLLGSRGLGSLVLKLRRLGAGQPRPAM